MKNNLYLTPLVPAERSAPGTFGVQQPNIYLPELINYAEHEGVQDWIREQLVPTIDWTELDRKSLQDQWRQTRNMNMLVHDDGQRYIGRSQSYLPLYRKNRRSLIAGLSRGLFPSDEYFGASDTTTGDPEKAQAAKHYAQWELEVIARFRQYIKRILSPAVDHGVSPAKVWYTQERRDRKSVV